jgi:hypothetical protein
MKKFILALFAVGSIATAQAQTGSILVFGNVGFHSAKDEAKNNTMSWNVDPGVGYQFNQHWTAGLVGGYGVDSSFKADGGKRLSAKHYSIGVFGRYTQPLGNIFALYGQLEARYQNMHASFDGEKVDGSDVNGFRLDFAPAVAINVTNGFALNFGFGGLGFASMKADGADNSSSDFHLTFGQQFNIGISKNFGCHKMHGNHEPGDEMRHMDTSDDDDSSSKKKKAKKDDDE